MKNNTTILLIGFLIGFLSAAFIVQQTITKMDNGGITDTSVLLDVSLKVKGYSYITYKSGINSEFIDVFVEGKIQIPIEYLSDIEKDNSTIISKIDEFVVTDTIQHLTSKILVGGIKYDYNDFCILNQFGAFGDITPDSIYYYKGGILDSSNKVTNGKHD